jgi:hypothetical protein
MWNAQSHQIWQKSRTVAFNLESDTTHEGSDALTQTERRIEKFLVRTESLDPQLVHEQPVLAERDANNHKIG